ncbi:hypothetical protein E4U45_007010 [Claviceps purpurea]|nr:hypothetical protein E4U45_007010 [Claviceps purpurea]
MTSEDSSSGYGSRNGDSATRCAFPQFMQLPPELRHHIWKLYCPDLSGNPRVLEFSLMRNEAILDRLNQHSLAIDPTVISQTKSLRTVLSTHRESRSIAVRIFPDELALDMRSRHAVVRFRKESDVVFLMELISDVNYIPPNFATEVQNLAVGAVQDFSEENIYYNEKLLQIVPAVKGMFPNLKKLYGLWPVAVWSAENLGNWCVTEYVHKYMLESDHRETGMREDTKALYCWPDLDAHPDFARSKVPKLCSLEEMEEAGLEIWSMVMFQWESCFRAYDKIRRLYLESPFGQRGR